ncbi:MAG: polysaccharide deacetylase family protein [Williamsia sp.]|nr:polysaccharide deacetylase family protein [Williamsia sp.]
MFYLVKTPWLIEQVLFPNYVWSMPGADKTIYLSFDDGPHPEITPFVLETLRQFGAGASFFCIGKNVVQHPGIYRQILAEGHVVGNHSHHHLNGWKTGEEAYVQDVAQAAQQIATTLYRPPYGRITRGQAKQLQNRLGLHIVMWSVVSGDFDRGLSPAGCLTNGLKAGPGAIVVFHDSEKAFSRMRYALPRVLEHYGEKGFLFKPIHL